MGGWTSISFSTEQQAKYGIDEAGTVLDKKQFNAAFAAPVAELNISEVHTYNCLTRELWSKEKQDWCCKKKSLGCPSEPRMCCMALTAPCLACKQDKTVTEFCDDPANAEVDGCAPADGHATVTQKNASEAPGAELGLSGKEHRPHGLPPWWILKGVKPEGPEKDMGGWTSISFSTEQQAKYGIDEAGTVLDKKQFNAAFAAPVAELNISEVHTYNCLTRELWSKEKQDWCCKKKSLGCPSEPRMCCMALTAPCLACKQDKTVTEFCDDPANAEVDGCASAEENAAVTQKKVSKALRGSSS